MNAVFLHHPDSVITSENQNLEDTVKVISDSDSEIFS